MKALVHTLWSEPRFPGAPRRVWRDWLLVGAIAVTVVIETLVRSDLFAFPATILAVAVLALSILWRRTNPLTSVVASFGAIILIDFAAMATNNTPDGPYSAVWILVLSYSLFRWGSGREVAIGFGVMLLTVAVGTIADFTGIGDAVGGTIFLLFPAALGASIRLQRTARTQQTERIKLEERAQIARELHDTVAHHVSAIAIQAQAGRSLAKSDSLDGAANALEAIEEEASRTLLEMRSMIGILRRGGSDAALTSEHGIIGLDQLATIGSDNTLRVTIGLSGQLDSVSDQVSNAVFRLAQESITNATRHSRDASVVDVRLHGDSDIIRLTVSDDGAAISGDSRPPGYGLIGMNERVNLLGGSFDAGPGAERGWLVRAELPRNAPSQ